MADVFISYAREDRDRIETLAKLIEAEGISCWFDQQLSGGERFAERTASELAAAKAVIVAWTRHSVDSHWVADEAGEARDAGKLAPITLDGSVPPLGFRQFQCVDFTAWRDGRDKPFLELLGALRRLLAKPGETLSPAPAAPPKRVSRIVIAAVAGLVFVAAAISAVIVLAPKDAPAVRIAVFTLTAPDGDPELSALAAGIADDIAAELAPSGIDVVARSETAKAESPRARARALKASLAVEGSVTREADEWKADVSVFSPSTGGVLMTQRFREKDAAPLRLRAATSTADALIGAGFAARGAKKAIAPESMSLLLRAAAAQRDGDAMAVRDLYTQIVKKDPGLAAGHVGLAIATSFSLEDAPPAQQAALRKEAKEAAARALAIDPKAADAYMALVNLEAPRDFAAREGHLVEGLGRDDLNSSLLVTYAFLLSEVGRVEEALGYFRRSVALDPLSVVKGQALADAEFNAGEIASARRRIEALAEAWPDDDGVAIARLRIALFGGREDEALSQFDSPEPPAGVFVPGQPAVEQLSCWKRAATAMKSDDSVVRLEGATSVRACRERNQLPRNTAIMLLAALGDVDGAFAVVRDSLANEMLGLEILFTPMTAGMRDDPRFMQLAKDAGLIDYWRSSGHWPDFCANRPPLDCQNAAALVE